MAQSKTKIIKSSRLGEQYTKILHQSGLPILLYPMAGFSGAYALFATKYGSVDNCFKTGTDADFVNVPDGIAHFLEHKLFESEDGDAFTLYAKTGASANAYTSFDRTAYLFSCTDHFEESIDILLNFVTKPYFTQQTVEKEQGIIGQEIKMYDDNADWRVLFNLLGALYHNNPVKVDIAGTVESISHIDADLLYRCYHTFYNLHNMALVVAGNFSPEVVIAAADRILKPADPVTIERKTQPEPPTVRQKRVEQILAVAQPIFQIGFKGGAGSEPDNLKGQILDELIMDAIAGESTPLYRRLYDSGLINQTFACEAMGGRDYTLTMFAGESRDPDKVYAEVLSEISAAIRNGIDSDAFSRCKKALYGRYVGMYGNVESVAGLMLTAHFYGLELYDILEYAAGLTPADASARLKTHFNPEYSALSIVKPQ